MIGIITVCLRKGYHHAFDDLVAHPPSGVKYVIPKIVSSGGQSGFVNVLKRKAWRTYSNLMRKPNMLKLNCGPDIDLIHSTSSFLIKNEMPWVVELEHASSFVGFEVGKLEKVKHIVEKYLSSDHCKRIMPWTKAGERSLHSALNVRKFKNKIEVIYPAMAPLNVKKKKHDELNLLFISYMFFNKGGKEVLEACDALSNEYDFNLTMISEVPNEYKKQYPQFNYVKPALPRKVILEKYFSTADIFVLPSYMDTFGMVYLEAMSAGIPVVASNVFALPEMLEGAGLFVDIGRYSWYGKDYLFAWKSWSELEKLLRNNDKPEIVGQIVKHLSTLIENSSLRTKLGRNGRKEIEKGKFSIQRRNRQLKRIYEESIKD